MRMNFFVYLAVFLGIYIQCVQSLPSSFTATSLGKQTFNASGVYGFWSIKKEALYADSSKKCQYWKQADKASNCATLRPKQSFRKGWIETVADVSELNGLGRNGNAESVKLINVRDPSWNMIASFCLIKPASGSGVSGIIMANWTYKKETEFSVPSGFHRFTLAYDYDTTNITLYVDNVYKTSVIAGKFPGDHVFQLECGYSAGENIHSKGTGKLYVRECNSFVPTIKSLYVDGEKGNDKNDGQKESAPLKTIEAAASKAMGGTTIYIADGVYRESFVAPSGDEKAPITFVGKGDEVYLSGAVSASMFKWTKGSNNIWSADVSSVMQKPPIFVTYKKKGDLIRLHQARTPNYKVETPWKVTEFWNTAMGGKKIMSCFGQDDCDDSNDVDTHLLSDEAFKTMDDLVGARIFMSDRISGHYYYNSTITKHDKKAGTITTDKERKFDGVYPGLGMYSQYYVYGKRWMIDEEGEYAYEDGKLYIKWSAKSLPDTLEFSRYDTGVHVSGTKYVTFENIHFVHYEKSAINENAGWNNHDYDGSFGVEFHHCRFSYDMSGIFISHGTTNANSLVKDWHIDRCSFTYMDGPALHLYSDSDKHFPNVGIVNFWVTNSYFYNLGFNSESNVGIGVSYAKRFIFLNNTVKYVSHNGLQMSYSASENGEISTGDSLFRGNLFDGICSGNSDCGCLKLWSVTKSHVWKNLLVMENLCQNTFGWTKTSYNRKKWGDRGYGGFGWYTDYVSGPVFYRNIAYNIGQSGFTIFKEWEDGTQTAIVNNLAVGNMNGVSLGGAEKQQKSQITIKNNVFVDTGLTGFQISRSNYPTPFDKFDVNNNVYYHLPWAGTKYDSGLGAFQDSNSRWQLCRTFEDLRKLAPKWETTEYWFDPQYGEYESMYNASYEDRHKASVFEDGTFAVTSPLIDKGTEKLPKIVTDLLKFFNIDDVRKGDRYDLGPYESGVESWIPSSKKTEESTMSSAHINFISIPLMVSILLFFIIF